MLLTDSLNLTHENLLTLIDIVILADSNTCNGPYIQLIATPPPCQSRQYLIQILV